MSLPCFRLLTSLFPMSVLPSLPCSHLTFLLYTSPTPTSSYALSLSLFLLSHGTPPPLFDAYRLSFTVSICFVSNPISLLLGLFLSFCIRLSLSPFLYFSSFSPPSFFFIPNSSPAIVGHSEAGKHGGSGHKKIPVLMDFSNVLCDTLVGGWGLIRGVWEGI